jgi:hypothetical protein
VQEVIVKLSWMLAPRSLGGAVNAVVIAVAPLATGAVVAARTDDPSPLLAVPAIVLGVLAATGPGLYIASAAVGSAPPLGGMVRAFGAALVAFGMALAGLVLPVAFVGLSASEPTTALVAATLAVATAAACALRRLARELAPATGTARIVYAGWAIATLGIAARLWWDLAAEVLT